MEAIKKISKYVGHDGNSYFCWNCGKAGFESPSHVNGHQSVCAKRQMPVTSPVTAILGGGGGGVAPVNKGLEIPISASDSNTEIAIIRQELGEIKADMKAQYSKVFNEIPHQQAVSNYGFLGISKESWIMIGIAVLLAYKLGHSSSCKCSVEGSSRRGLTLQDKVTDKAITYGLNRVFKI